MEQGISFEESQKKLHSELRFRSDDWLALLGISFCAAGYAFLHPSVFTTGNLIFPGIGMTVSTWLILVICMAYIGWNRLKWNKQSIFLLTSSLLLSASYGIFSNNALRYMNLPVLITLCILSIYSLKGVTPILNPGGMTNAVCHATHSIGKNLPLPAFALRNQLKSGENRRIRELLLGLGICIPVIGVVLILLCDADSIFSALINTLFSGLHTSNGGAFLWNLIRLLMLSLLLFAFVYGLKQEFRSPKRAANKIVFPKLTAATLLAAMSIVYAVFVYVQCRYLFTGTEAVLAESEYAEYARSGFFQLVAVAFITMCIVLPLLIRIPDSRILRILSIFVALMTMVIILSAFWRMRLYILEFGLTFLRTVTLWGMLAITAAMIATLVKAIQPRIRIFRALFIFTICTWLAFNYCNVNQCIVKYNVSAYKSGKLENIDLDYLKRMGPEALSVMEMLQEENELSCEEMGKLLQYRQEILECKPSFYDWNLSWWDT